MNATPARNQLSSAPPAESLREEPVMLTAPTPAPLILSLEIPQVALRNGDKICRHPESGDPVSWRVTSLRRDDHDRLVVDYIHPDGTDTHTFTDPDAWVRVETGEVAR